jgi:nitroreductase
MIFEEWSMRKELMKTILARRSIRKYTSEPVGKKDITAMLKAAMAAPSGSDLKPWHFIVVTDRKILDNLASVHPYGRMLFKAPLCIAVCGDTTTSASLWVQDCSAATENLLLMATAMGLGAVWVGVYPRENRVKAVRKVLGLPETVAPLNLISIGHPAEEKEPRTQYDKLRVHRGRW